MKISILLQVNNVKVWVDFDFQTEIKAREFAAQFVKTTLNDLRIVNFFSSLVFYSINNHYIRTMKIEIDLDKYETFSAFRRRYVLQNGKPISPQCLQNWINRGVVRVKHFKEVNLKLILK